MATRLKKEYLEKIKPAMKQQFGYKNDMEVPRLDKIVINMGVGENAQDSKKIQGAVADMTALTGQKPLVIRARANRSPPSSCAKAFPSAAKSHCAASVCMNSSTV